MKTRPLSLCPELVPAVLDGRKTMTRRPVRLRGEALAYFNSLVDPGLSARVRSWCPFGAVGEGLWLRERARVMSSLYKARWPDGLVGPCIRIRYEATGNEADVPYPDRMSWIPRVGHCIPNGVHKEGSRWSSVIVEVRVERVQSITEEDARAEGMDWRLVEALGTYAALYHSAVVVGGPIGGFRWFWSRIYPGSWERNDWVWCVRWEGRR